MSSKKPKKLKYKSRSKRREEATDWLKNAAEKLAEGVATLTQTILDAEKPNGGGEEKVRAAWSATKQLFDDANTLIEDGKGVLEELHEEMLNWQESIPENLQSGDKYDQVSTAADELDSAVNVIVTDLSTDIKPNEDFVEQIETIIDNANELVEEATDAADQADGVEFPGMFG